MLLEVNFAGECAKLDPIHGVKTAAMQRDMGKETVKWLKDIEAAGAFLMQHETAKIIVSIDTHCLEENGLLIYSDGGADDIGACSLETVGVFCVWYCHGCDSPTLLHRFSGTVFLTQYTNTCQRI